ncbi:MAG: phosphatidylserine decarboxylase family protein [Phycisphaerae bacterium]|nr:phosphatidylserine decarboxylase family protein [Phycisphaerae bacterium]
MRIPLHPAGGREIAILSLAFGGPAVLFAVAAVGWGHAWCWLVAGLLALLWLGGLLFFRDPERTVPSGDGLLVAPADGRVVETVRLDEEPHVGGPATRLSIFLSVFDVHVNRSPCAGVVRSIQYQPGRFLDARDTRSGSLNEANTIVIAPDDPDAGLVVVRQIAGLIARRIVCTVKVGDRVRLGQRIGLIKFGSRTELVVAGHDAYEPAVRVGDRARGAVTIMARRTDAAQVAAAARTGNNPPRDEADAEASA